MTKQKELVLKELDTFMTWWEAHYNIKKADDVRCDEIRPLYVAWKDKDKPDEHEQVSDETTTPIREEENNTEINIQERQEV